MRMHPMEIWGILNICENMGMPEIDTATNRVGLQCNPCLAMDFVIKIVNVHMYFLFLMQQLALHVHFFVYKAEISSVSCLGGSKGWD